MDNTKLAAKAITKACGQGQREKRDSGEKSSAAVAPRVSAIKPKSIVSGNQ
jgi:hypothetical protein